MAVPAEEPLRALFEQYDGQFAGDLILQGLSTWVAGEYALAATRFEQARDSFQPDQSPQEWNILDEWVQSAADLFLAEVEAAIAAGEMPTFKAVGPNKYDETKHERDENGRWANQAGAGGNSATSTARSTQKPATSPTAAPVVTGKPSTAPTPPTRTFPPVVTALEDKFYEGSDAKSLGWSRPEFAKIVDGLEATMFAVGRISIPTTAQQALGWARAGKITDAKAQFGMNTKGLVNLVVDTEKLREVEAVVGDQRVPGVDAARLMSMRLAATMSHLYAPALADIHQSGYAPFWLMRNLAIVMGDRTKAIDLDLGDGLPLAAVEGILTLGDTDEQALIDAFQVGVQVGDSGDDLADVDFVELKEKQVKPLKATKVKRISDSERVRLAWVTRHLREKARDEKYNLRAVQRNAAGIPDRYTAGRFAQLATKLRLAMQAARQARRMQNVAERNARMTGGRSIKSVSAQIQKHLGPGPHPNGSSQDVHQGGSGGSSPILQELQAMRSSFAEAAQKVYDDWEVDADGMDDVHGGGGICDDVAGNMGDLLSEAGFDVLDGGLEGDDHAYVIAVDHEAQEAYAVDIPPGVYETGGGYNWKKRPNVRITPGDVIVERLNYADVANELDKHMGGPSGDADHPDGTPQSVHAGGTGWKDGIGGILREKVRERIEEYQLKSGEKKQRTVTDFKFTYAGTDKEITPEDMEYVKKLGIGPAYTDVKINPDFKSDGLIATYTDAKGRSVRMYSKAHTENAAQEKFERLKAFNDALPGIQAAIRTDIDASNAKTRQAARVLYLIELSAFRIGGTADTGADKQAYGASTLLVKHAKVKGDTVTFKFTGKKGVAIKQVVKDATLARIVTEEQANAAPTETLFNSSDAAVRDYLDGLPGAKDFKVKDFRTWNATKLALELVQGVPPFKTEAEFTKFQKQVAVKVSDKLNNQPAEVLKSYIDFHVWDQVRDPALGAWKPKFK